VSASPSSPAGGDGGFVERSPDGPYRLGLKLVALSDRVPDLNALAVPVIGRGDELVAILGLQGPAARLPASTRRALRAPLRRAASERGRSPGGRG
jgi:DNA-binding IclR family transcriptional regulator